MVKTASNMLALGTCAPHFYLEDVASGKMISLGKKEHPKATLIMFICNHCPYVKHANKGIVALAKDYQPKGVRFIAINSNDIEQYPEDSPQHMQQVAKETGYIFPYLFDKTQEVAKAYHAACTPDFFLFDKKLALVYRGQLDDSRPGNDIPITGESIRTALDCLLLSKPLPTLQKPSLGCNIKWKITK
ncbi:MAG: thioredoxin [Legionellales bacterium RIFCSPHIGHO2_12_FULL_37_14]|nr:MAG: thioredoxin [Legionellales bacterium RIFCSPHIGHO2_12_FULL_37_14]